VIAALLSACAACGPSERVVEPPEGVTQLAVGRRAGGQWLDVTALSPRRGPLRVSVRAEDDVIVLGDLNAGPPQFGRIKQIPGIGWAVSGATTNTRRTKTYDNLVFDRTVTTEYTGRWGVVDLQNTFGLSIDKALEVSDHNPVWAAFSPWELRPPLQAATAPRDASR
jgi:hypothetical protein